MNEKLRIFVNKHLRKYSNNSYDSSSVMLSPKECKLLFLYYVSTVPGPVSHKNTYKKTQ